jgi:periplasmic divalent cation tolerance protein
MPAQPLLVLTTLPDASIAESMAAKLISDKLAACISIGAPVRSLYHWQGKTETASEIPMTIKTTVDVYPALEATIRSLHPYDLPEIIALPITAGLAPYLDWIATSCNRSAATDTPHA